MRRRHRSRGQALAEFALAVPIFAILLFGIIDVARMVYAQNTLNNAAREAARAISVTRWPPECNGLTNGAVAGNQRGQCAITVAQARSLAVIGTTVPAGTPKCEHVGNTDGNGDGELDRTVVSSGPATTWQNCHPGDYITVTVQAPFTLVTPMISRFIGTPTLKGEAQVTTSSS